MSKIVQDMQLDLAGKNQTTDRVGRSGADLQRDILQLQSGLTAVQAASKSGADLTVIASANLVAT